MRALLGASPWPPRGGRATSPAIAEFRGAPYAYGANVALDAFDQSGDSGEASLIRVIENDSRATRHQLKKVFRPLMVAQHTTEHGLVSETNPVTSDQKRVLDALRVKPPARFPNVPTAAAV